MKKRNGRARGKGNGMFTGGSTLKRMGNWIGEKKSKSQKVDDRALGQPKKKKKYHMIGCVSGHIYCIKLHAMLSFHLPKNLHFFESGVTGIFGDVSIKELVPLHSGPTLLLHSHLLSFRFSSHSHPKG